LIRREDLRVHPISKAVAHETNKKKEYQAFLLACDLGPPHFLLAHLGKHVPATQGIERPRERGEGGIVTVSADERGRGMKPK
jgi:hypothetical protein